MKVRAMGPWRSGHLRPQVTDGSVSPLVHPTFLSLLGKQNTESKWQRGGDRDSVCVQPFQALRGIGRHSFRSLRNFLSSLTSRPLLVTGNASAKTSSAEISDRRAAAARGGWGLGTSRAVLDEGPQQGTSADTPCRQSCLARTGADEEEAKSWDGGSGAVTGRGRSRGWLGVWVKAQRKEEGGVWRGPHAPAPASVAAAQGMRPERVKEGTWFRAPSSKTSRSICRGTCCSESNMVRLQPCWRKQATELTRRRCWGGRNRVTTWHLGSDTGRALRRAGERRDLNCPRAGFLDPTGLPTLTWERCF